MMASKLADKDCVPCKGDVPPLKPDEYAPLLKQIDGWAVDDGRKLIKSFAFGDFLGAMGFANAITPVAEAEGHHPDLLVRWGEVRVYLWTHKIDGLTESDFIMAAKIDRVAETAAVKS